VGESSGLPRDIDRFDRDYLQLVLWDRENLEIAGAYRLCVARQLLDDKGWDGLYTSTLFEFSETMRPVLEQGLELGRSFVQPRYQNKQSLDHLWQGIGAYIRKNPGFRYLFGPASISPLYGEEATARIVHFYSTRYVDGELPLTLPAILSASGPNTSRKSPPSSAAVTGRRTSGPCAMPWRRSECQSPRCTSTIRRRPCPEGSASPRSASTASSESAWTASCWPTWISSHRASAGAISPAALQAARPDSDSHCGRTRGVNAAAPGGGFGLCGAKRFSR
jgi:hypothetical protein